MKKKNYIKRTTLSPFATYSVSFLNADTVTLKDTGEVIKVPHQAFKVYTHMRNMWCMNTEQGNKYFESWAMVAKACGLDAEFFKDKQDKNKVVKSNTTKDFLIKTGMVVEGGSYQRCCYKTVRDVAELINLEFSNNGYNQYKEMIETLRLDAYAKYREDQSTPEQETPKKHNNFMFAKTNRDKLKALGDTAKLTQFNKWYSKQDNAGIELGVKDYERFLVECGYIEQKQPLQSEPQDVEPHMQPCDGTESYFTLTPPISAYEQDYRPTDELNFSVLADIKIEGAPSVDQWDCPPLGDVELVEEVLPEQPKQEVTPPEVAPSTVVCGDKSKLLKCFRPNTNISEIDINGKGVGYFAKPLHNKECDRDTARQYLKVLHSHYWDEYNPDQTVINEIMKWLVCDVCSSYTDERGYCSDHNCSTNALPF